MRKINRTMVEWDWYRIATAVFASIAAVMYVASFAMHVLSENESSAYGFTAEQFLIADSNNDGKLTTAEAQSYIESDQTKAPTSPVIQPTLRPTLQRPDLIVTEPPVPAWSPPTFVPVPEPTNYPTSTPTGNPTDSPTSSPTDAPTVPTHKPTLSPTEVPTTKAPTPYPTTEPTGSPTKSPTFLREQIEIAGQTVFTPNIVVILADDMGYGDVSINYERDALHQSKWDDGTKRADQNNSPQVCETGSQLSYPILNTQHLDGLAKNGGIVFNNFHAGNPVCTPTRASILSGRLPGRDVIDYVDDTGKNQQQNSKYGASDSESAYCLPKRTWTTAWAAKEKGYATAFFGKWHLGNLHNSKTYNKRDNTPIDYGFDYFAATTTNAATHDVTIHAACKQSLGLSGPEGLGHYAYGKHDNTGINFWSQSVDNVIVKRSKNDPFLDNQGAPCMFSHNDAEHTAYDHASCDPYLEPYSFIEYGNDPKQDSCGNPDNNIANIRPEARGSSAEYLMREAIAFIEDNYNGGKVPFFVEICTWHMHTPFTGSVNYNSDQYKISSGNLNSLYTNYKGSLEELDDSIAYLQSELSRLGELDDTIIIFTTDNGQEVKKRSGGSGGPYSGCKREEHEGGHRVPGLLSWPRVISKLYETSRPSATMDVLPTMEHLFSSLPNDPTFNNVYDTDFGGVTMRNRDRDGESFLSVIVNAINNNVDTPIGSSNEDLRNSHLRIAAHDNGDWVMYSKDGRYKWRSDDDSMYDLQTNPKEFGTDKCTTNECLTQKALIKAEYATVCNSYNADRQLVKNNFNLWSMCFEQNAARVNNVRSCN